MTKRSNSNDMNALNIGPTDITRPKIRCHSVVRRLKFNYSWTIVDYKSAFVTIDKGNNHSYKNARTLLSQPFTATNERYVSKWTLEIQRCKINDRSPDTTLCLCLRRKTDFSEDLNVFKAVEIKCAIINSVNQKSYSIQQKYLLDSGKEEEFPIGNIITSSELSKNENALLPQNKLTLDFEITIYRQEDVMGTYQEIAIPLEPIDPNLESFGKLFNNSEFSDVTIRVNGKDYPAHKSILVGRSPVFAATLKNDINQTNRIDVEGIEEKVFLEALRFIYTGKVENLETLAFKLLPVAVKFDLERLKAMCANELCKKLAVGTAVKILVLADMYNVENLKNQAINFIRDYSVDVISKVDSEAWNGLMSQPILMKEVFLACLK